MGDLAQIYSKLTEMDGKLDDLIEWKGRLDERCKYRGEQIEGVQSTLYGHSNNGLVSKVQTLLNCKKNIKASIESWRGFAFYILSRLIVIGIVGVIAWLLVLYRKG